MLDRLKFRFWHKPTNKMMNCYCFNQYFVFGDTLDGIGTEYNPAEFNDCILMQCTGLCDKNGKLIYEGDCLGDVHNVVEYLNGGYFVAGDKPLEALNSSLEVVGNIYQNTELLEE